MELYRINPRGREYQMTVNGKERLVDKVVVYDRTGPIISCAPCSMSEIWPYRIKLPEVSVELKRKADYSREYAFVLVESCRGFSSRYILYLPKESIGLSEPTFTKSEDSSYFEELRDTLVENFVFRTYHFINEGLIAIDGEICHIGKELQIRSWTIDAGNILDSYIQQLQALKYKRDAELKRIKALTAQDLRRSLERSET